MVPVREVAPYIVIGYIVNHYCLMFVREVAPYIVIGYVVNLYCLMFVREVSPPITIYGATSLTNIKQ
jgi:mannose/fructose/N-acetylgalactosamine-specific phosphotransferase system component IIC